MPESLNGVWSMPNPCLKRVLNRDAFERVMLQDGSTWTLPDHIIRKLYDHYYSGDIYNIQELSAVMNYAQILELANILVYPLSEFPSQSYNVVVKHLPDSNSVFFFYPKFDPRSTDDLHKCVDDLVYQSSIEEARSFLRRLVDKDHERLFDEHMYHDSIPD